jgi:DNA-binding Lrp family transcriptional regulator
MSPSARDQLDRAILAIVQADARIPADQIGLRVGLSASAVQRRLGRLREAGIIKAEIAVLDAKALGRTLTVLVELSIDRDRPEQIAEVKNWIASEPAVQQAWYITGEADVVLVVTATGMEEYEALIGRLFEVNRNVRKYRTSVALSTLKSGLGIPLEQYELLPP